MLTISLTLHRDTQAPNLKSDLYYRPRECGVDMRASRNALKCHRRLTSVSAWSVVFVSKMDSRSERTEQGPSPKRIKVDSPSGQTDSDAFHLYSSDGCASPGHRIAAVSGTFSQICLTLFTGVFPSRWRSTAAASRDGRAVSNRHFVGVELSTFSFLFSPVISFSPVVTLISSSPISMPQ